MKRYIKLEVEGFKSPYFLCNNSITARVAQAVAETLIKRGSTQEEVMDVLTTECGLELCPDEEVSVEE